MRVTDILWILALSGSVTMGMLFWEGWGVVCLAGVVICMVAVDRGKE